METLLPAPGDGGRSVAIAMRINPSLLDSQHDSLDAIQSRLSDLDGSRAKLWDYVRSRAAVVVCVAPVNQDCNVFLDCISCTTILAEPAWQPTRLRIQSEIASNAGMILTDGDMLRIACSSVRLSTEATTVEWFCGPSALHSYFDLLERFRNAGSVKATTSFTSLCNYLNGYDDALRDNGLGWNVSLPSLFEFELWLKLRFGYLHYAGGWRNVIQAEFPNDQTAYAQFFLLLDEFRREYAMGNINVADLRRHVT